MTTINTAFAQGLLSARPAAAAGNSGYHYFATDVAGGTLYQSTGSAWVQLSAPVGLNARYHQAVATLQTVASTATTVINFDTLDYDANSAVTTGASWHFTCPVAGKYHVGAMVLFNNRTWTAGESLALFIYKNGSAVSHLDFCQRETSTSLYGPLSGSDTIQCSASDTLDIRVSNQTSFTQTLIGDVTYNHVAIELVG